MPLKQKCFAFSDYTTTSMREIISLQYFKDGLKNGEIERAVRMTDGQDIKSTLLYALKLKAATQACLRDHQPIQGAKMTADAPCESPWRKEIKKLKYPHHASVIESKKVCSHRKGSIHGNADALSRRPPVLIAANTAKSRKEMWRNGSNSPPNYDALNIRTGPVE
ncbi:uncharacterized protein TNCV_886131 [Trichonephila clavipes]|nr:uncharacterized protein TNCV_886131 [Trichonephila clavipes]